MNQTMKIGKNDKNSLFYEIFLFKIFTFSK